MADEILLTDENIPPMQEELFRLYSQGFLTDITLSCEDGKNFEAHRVLLAARSQYFYGIVPKLKVEPVIFLKGVKGSYLEKILKYIYSGTATVSRSQLKPILEVAKSLQVRGLQDLAPTELSRGTNTSFQSNPNYSGSKTSSPVPSKSKDDSYHRLSPQNAREIALQQQKKIYDKLSYSKRSPLKNSSSPQLSSHRRGKGSSQKENNIKSLIDDEEEVLKFQYEYIPDDSEDSDDKDDSNDSDFEMNKKNPRDVNSSNASGELSNKKKRGRPAKSQAESPPPSRGKKNYDKSLFGYTNKRKSSKSSSDEDTDNSSDLDQDSDSESEADSEDQSDDDEDDDDERRTPSRISKSTSPHRQALKESPLKGSSSKGRTDNYYEVPTGSSPRRGRGPTVNGKPMLAVQCKGKRAELHLSKFGNGTSGKSIKYKGEWMTPEDYEQACGIKTRKYLESITTDYGPLKTLTVSGLLKPHPKKCKCSVCTDEVQTSPDLKSLKREEQEGERLRSESKGSDRTREKKRESSPAPGADSDSKKRKQEGEESGKNSRSQSQTVGNHSSSSSRQLSSKTSRDKAASKSDPLQPPTSKLSPSISKSDIISPATLSSTKTMTSSPITAAPTISTSSSFSPSSSKPLASPSFIALSPATSLNTLTSTMVTSSALPSPSFSAKFSNSSLSPSYSSTASSVSTVSSLPSHQSSLPTVTTTSSQSAVKSEARYLPPPPGSVSSKPPVNIAMGPPKAPEPLQMVSSVAQSPGQGISPQQLHLSHKTNVQPGQGRLGSVMQVRCKSVSALLYVAKYESGSKGKCILVNEEWMTPNEFEEKAGSKAKKYLSSIKCSGRPLRAYVNSGELRGTGPIPVAKPPKISSKPKNPQPIAPAPGPGGAGPASYGLPPPMSPAHMSASMPQSLTQVAMMQNSVGQPILLNQSNLAVSIAGQSQMSQAQLIQPMTFTLAPMSMQGQQLHHQQLQHHQLQGGAVGQQLHSSADYILQHK